MEEKGKLIDIKKDTDRLENEQIKQLINNDLFGDYWKLFHHEELNRNLECLTISSHKENSQLDDIDKLFEDPFGSLMNRPKSAHLTFGQKSWIYQWYRVEGKSMNQISQLTGISISTTRRIISEFSTNVRREEIYAKIRCKRLIETKAVSRWISKFVSEKTDHFTARDVHEHIRDQLWISVPLHQVRKHPKEKEHLSNKKGNARPATLNVDRIGLLKQQFWIRITRRLPDIKIMINVDENSITRDTKLNYSWLKTGVSCSITNIKFKNSVNMITAIGTNGLDINMLKYESTTAKTFWIFIEYVLSYLREEGFKPQDVGIILDNWPIHRAGVVREYWRNKGTKLYYLPQYSPELAPVEVYFSRIKKAVTKEAKNELVDLRTEESIKMVASWIHEVDSNYVKRLWSRLMTIVMGELEKI